MFKGIFKNKEMKQTKIEEWKNFELFDLFKDLEQAEHILSNLTIQKPESVEKFYKDFIEELYDVKNQNVPNFKQICIWFASTSTWNKFVGEDGIKLGNRIFKRADKWNKVNC